MTWETVKLSDCCSSVADGDHQPPPKAESGVPFVTISNIDASNQFDFSNTMYVPLEYYELLDNKRKAQVGDVLYSVVGSFGIPVLIKESIPFVFQRHIAILRPDERILPAFLYYTMLSRDFYSKADAAAIGAAQRTVSLNALRNMEIALPPISVQNSIVGILSAYDDLIENNQKQIKLLEEAAQRLYKEWFTDLRFPGYEQTPIHDGVPEGWERTSLEALVEFNPKYSVPKETEKRAFPMASLSTASMVLDHSESTNTMFTSGSKFKNSDTLLARITPCLENGKTAFVDGLLDNEVAIGSTEFIVMRSKRVNPYMVYLLARSDDFRKTAINSMTGSDGRQRAQVDKLKQYPCLYPDQGVIDQFGVVVAPIFSQIQMLNKQNSSLREARDRLLPKLMSGEIVV